MHANKLSNRPKKRHGQSMVTNWRICEKTDAMKSFYKKVKSMRKRDQPYCPITTIKYLQGQIITDKHQIKQSWGGYFERLLNPNEDTRDNNFSVQYIMEHEPEILRSEIEESLK